VRSYAWAKEKSTGSPGSRKKSSPWLFARALLLSTAHQRPMTIATIEVNETFENYTGWCRDEVIGPNSIPI